MAWAALSSEHTPASSGTHPGGVGLPVLESTTDDLEPGQAVLPAALELLDRPRDLYDEDTGKARKMRNKAIFTRRYLDSTDHRPTATAATLSRTHASNVSGTILRRAVGRLPCGDHVLMIAHDGEAKGLWS